MAAAGGRQEGGREGGLAGKYRGADPLALDLLERMLAFDPAQRLTVAEALAHPYLAEAPRLLQTLAPVPGGVKEAERDGGWSKKDLIVLGDDLHWPIEEIRDRLWRCVLDFRKEGSEAGGKGTGESMQHMSQAF